MRWEQERLAHTLLMTNGGRASPVWREEAEEPTALFYLGREERVGKEQSILKHGMFASTNLLGKRLPPSPLFDLCHIDGSRWSRVYPKVPVLKYSYAIH